MQNTLADRILQRPDAAKQIKYLQAVFEDETKRRKKFREWVTDDIKAEFVNGKVIIHSPVTKRHWSANNLLSRLLSFFASIKDVGEVGTEKVMITLSRNDYEPDLVFFSKEKADQFEEDQVLFPAPDFVVEILSKSTAKNDKTTKKEDYAMHGIPEYWIIDPVKQKIHQHILPEGSTEYFPAKIYQHGSEIESDVIKGFTIPVAAIFDKSANIKALENLLASNKK